MSGLKKKGPARRLPKNASQKQHLSEFEIFMPTKTGSSRAVFSSLRNSKMHGDMSWSLSKSPKQVKTTQYPK